MNNLYKTEKLGLKSYLLAFLVLALTIVVFIVAIIAIPYLFYLILKIFFISLKFGVIFVFVFWLIVVIFLWIAKLLEILQERN